MTLASHMLLTQIGFLVLWKLNCYRIPSRPTDLGHKLPPNFGKHQRQRKNRLEALQLGAAQDLEDGKSSKVSTPVGKVEPLPLNKTPHSDSPSLKVLIGTSVHEVLI